LSGRPILVLFQSDDGVLTRLRAIEHLSPVVVPAAALAAGDYLARLIASQVLQIFQNGDDAALTVSAASPPPEAPAGAPGQEEITRWLALSAGRILAGAGRAVDLVLAGEALARMVLETLEVAGGSVDQAQAGAPVMRSTTSPLFFVRLARPDPDLVVDAVERLRRTDPDRLALRPY
jgi:hypothetical protein